MIKILPIILTRNAIFTHTHVYTSICLPFFHPLHSLAQCLTSCLCTWLESSWFITSRPTPSNRPLSLLFPSLLMYFLLSSLLYLHTLTLTILFYISSSLLSSPLHSSLFTSINTHIHTYICIHFLIYIYNYHYMTQRVYETFPLYPWRCVASATLTAHPAHSHHTRGTALHTQPVILQRPCWQFQVRVCVCVCVCVSIFMRSCS